MLYSNLGCLCRLQEYNLGHRIGDKVTGNYFGISKEHLSLDMLDMQTAVGNQITPTQKEKPMSHLPSHKEKKLTSLGACFIPPSIFYHFFA
jgi:hypothetical protein